MNEKQSWTATHLVTLRDPVSGEILRDPESGNVLNAILVMMIDDRRAYQEHEWESGANMGDPDLMKDSDGAWTYHSDPVLAKFEKAASDEELGAWRRSQFSHEFGHQLSRLSEISAGRVIVDEKPMKLSNLAIPLSVETRKLFDSLYRVRIRERRPDGTAGRVLEEPWLTKDLADELVEAYRRKRTP